MAPKRGRKNSNITNKQTVKRGKTSDLPPESSDKVIERPVNTRELRSGRNNVRLSNIMPDLDSVISDEAPVIQLTNLPRSSAGSLSAGSSSSAIFALHEEPENPIPFKAAFEF